MSEGKAHELSAEGISHISIPQPFRCHVIRPTKGAQGESKPPDHGVTGIWVGKSTMVKGAVRVMQVRWDAAQCKWQIVDVGHVKCGHASFPLRGGTEAQQPTQEVSEGFSDKYNMQRPSSR